MQNRGSFIAILAAAAALGVLATHADAGAAGPSENCKALASRVAQAAGVSPGKPGESKTAFIFKAAHGADIHVRCASESNRSAIVDVNSSAEMPPRSFYDALASVGAAISGRPVKDVRKRLHRCHRLAKRTANGIAQRALHGVGLECHRSEAGSSFRFKGPFLRQPG